MSTLDNAISKPRIVRCELKDRRIVWLRELFLDEAWPYIQGAGVNPGAILRQSLCDESGAPALGEDESLPLAVALELLPMVLELNGLEADTADTVEAVESDLSLVGSRG